MPRCFLATKSRPLKHVAAASRCSVAAEPAADAAARNNRSTIGSISAAQAVQSIQEPVMLPCRGSLRGVHAHRSGAPPQGSAGARLLPSVPLPVEALERPGGGGALPAAVSTMSSRHAMPPVQPMPLVSTAATLRVKQEEDCRGECSNRNMTYRNLIISRLVQGCLFHDRSFCFGKLYWAWTPGG